MSREAERDNGMREPTIPSQVRVMARCAATATQLDGLGWTSC